MGQKVAIVTGASRGIGLAAAEKFCSLGYITYFVSRSGSEKRTKELSAKGQGAFSYKCDLSAEQEVKKMCGEIIKKHSGIDVLVNCAGIVKPGKVDQIPLSEWEFMIANNLTSYFLACKHSVPIMKKQRAGKIINISSIAGRSKSRFAGVHYVCAKAAIIGLTRQLAYELGEFGINVNCIAPGQTDTPMLRSVLTPEKEQATKKAIPLGYIAKPEQIANVIVFLASEE